MGISLLVAGRLARSLVRATAELAAVSHRVAGGDLRAAPPPTGRPSWPSSPAR